MLVTRAKPNSFDGQKRSASRRLHQARRAICPADPETSAQNRARRLSGCRRNDQVAVAVFERKGIICFMAAFKQHCVFGFWKGSLIFGGKHKGAMRHFGRITSMHDLPNQKMLVGFVRRAAELNEAGTRKSRPRPRAKREINVPADLKAALQRKVKARKTLENFSYSHKKEYVDWITDAKRDETRRRRLETAIQWLAQGNPQNWKYL